ncbi:endonuclease/exonuclease/phosphatase family protein [Parafilimonas terrae]|uniref:Endonuclease/Exonuclease/phosphatase family protein n=1 Tax=Parafilimonas terrae TaxID=1465490 RepID=A0A1I5YHC2_9BACT|nr:endonuclease/exonuclease/phosphatase [Parafilimonas terrae]SFQ43576.1 Endonuclease/Exonuclease/phosphatase family protein [Parafilimonas terrae]
MKTVLLLLIAILLFKITDAQTQHYKPAVIAFYNLENFFDTINNPKINDEDFLPGGVKHYNSKVYQAKVLRLATVISQIGTDINPDGFAFIGIAEIENDTVLNDLIHHPLLKDRNYGIVHYDSRDIRGVDVALLYNPKYFTVLNSRKLFVPLPEGAKTSAYTRDVLWVKGILNGDTVYVFVNHWPSRVGGEQRSAPGRFAAAQVNRNFIDSIEKYKPGAKIIVMGDLNDDPINESITKVLGATGKIADVKPGGLYNPWVDLYKRGIGTLAYQDAWGLFDQIIISYAWLDKNQQGYFFFQPHIFNKEFMVENTGKYKGYPMRTWDGNVFRGGYSDHFPTYIVLLKKVE